MKQFLLIIPVYNGVTYIDQTVSELVRFFNTNPQYFDILWVDDGSLDGTKQEIQRCTKKTGLSMDILSYSDNKGKGGAIAYALKQVQNRGYHVIGFTDVELPYGIGAVDRQFQHLRDHKNTDIVVGTRLACSVGLPQYHWYRRLTRKVFRLCVPSIISTISDTQCGVKAFRASVMQDIFSRLQTHRWVFDIEVFVIARLLGFCVYEIPVNIKPTCIERRGGVSFFRHGFSLVKDILCVYYSMMTKRYE